MYVSYNYGIASLILTESLLTQLLSTSFSRVQREGILWILKFKDSAITIERRLVETSRHSPGDLDIDIAEPFCQSYNQRVSAWREWMAYLL